VSLASLSGRSQHRGRQVRPVMIGTCAGEAVMYYARARVLLT
jgi:hypothetical protein